MNLTAGVENFSRKLRKSEIFWSAVLEKSSGRGRMGKMMRFETFVSFVFCFLPISPIPRHPQKGRDRKTERFSIQEKFYAEKAHPCGVPLASPC